jgi:hypothetical protein
MTEQPSFQVIKGGNRKKAMVESLMSVKPDIDADTVKKMVDKPAPPPAVAPAPMEPAPASRTAAPPAPSRRQTPAAATSGKTYVWPASQRGGRVINLPAFNPAVDVIVLDIGKHYVALRGDNDQIALVLDNGDQLLLPLGRHGLSSANQLLSCLRWSEAALLPIPLTDATREQEAPPTKPAIQLDDFLSEGFDARNILRELEE